MGGKDAFLSVLEENIREVLGSERGVKIDVKFENEQMSCSSTIDCKFFCCSTKYDVVILC